MANCPGYVVGLERVCARDARCEPRRDADALCADRDVHAGARVGRAADFYRYAARPRAAAVGEAAQADAAVARC